MKKILKISQCLCLCAAILLSAANKAEAFIPLPPMPWSLEIDLPGNVGKAVSVAKSLILQYKTIKSQTQTLTLKHITGNLSQANKLTSDKGGIKNPGKGTATGNINGTNLSKDKPSEEDYFDAYNKLFLIAPSTETYEIDEEKGIEGYQIYDMAYKNKAIEYKQDIIIDTYFTGMLTERYLMLVEKTLKRLEECQNSIRENNCVFFGLEMVEIPSAESTDEVDAQGEDNPGILAQMKNAYIVSTVYDRLMRIVEDLTATEAIYRASKQLDITTPVELEESSADKYIPQTYNFAYRDVEEKIYAKKSILSTNNRSECFSAGGKGCAGYNDTRAELTNMDNAAIMADLDKIEGALNDAAELHNMKMQMPKYKTKYRQYLIAQEIHARALDALKKSDNCAYEFWEEKKHKTYCSWNVKEEWGKTANGNDHENRKKGSISRDLIELYEQRTMNKIISADEDCDGYYENCPMGYILDETKHCEVYNENGELIREREELHPCVIETITGEESEEELNLGEEDEDKRSPSKIDKVKDSDEAENVNSNPLYSSSNYLKNTNGEDDINTGSRISAESTWRIGSDYLMKLVKERKMNFEPWIDQRNFQEEYLRQKYINIESMIKSIDSAVNAYKMVATEANDVETTIFKEKDDEIMNNLREMTDAISACASMEDARKQAEAEFCTGSTEYETQVSCNVVVDNNTGIITGTREVKTPGDEEPSTYTKEWEQIVSLDNTCTFKSAEQESLVINNSDKNKLSVGNLVKGYYNKVLGNDEETIEENAEAMYTKAYDNGRRVAQDELKKVIDVRIDENNKMKELIRNHENEISALKNKITQNKNKIDNYNNAIDEATKKKNMATEAKKLASQRLENIAIEQKMLRERQAKTGDSENESKCSTNYKIMKLDYERNQINQNNAEWNCPQLCKELEICSNEAENYTITFDVFEKMGKENQNPSKYVAINEADTVVKEQKKLIDTNTARRELLKEENKKIEEIIEDKNEKFADMYLEKAEESQNNIEEANQKFENFMEKDARMQNKNKKGSCKKSVPILGCISHNPKTYEKDDLTTTITQIFAENKKNDDLKDVVKEAINDELAGNIGQISSILTKNNDNLLLQFVVDETFSKFGMASGVYTMAEIIEKVKEAIVEAAADIVTGQVTDADEKIAKAQKDALDKVAEVRKKVKVCEECKLEDWEKIDFSQRNCYVPSKNDWFYDEVILVKHKELIEYLQKIAEEIKIPNIFGIPEDVLKTDEETGEEKLKVDEEYYVDLPARGFEYRGKEEYENSLDDKDKNAGRDYLAPKEPLLGLPPVREVFYYSAQDYDDTPKSKKRKKPAIPYLLNKKYPGVADKYASEWEYIPEIWRYLLARPNLREDRKYQQTFGERSLESTRLKQLLEVDDEKMTTTIARGETYPCKMYGNYFDVEGNENMTKIKYIITSKGQLNTLTIPQCYDIKMYNERPCNKYKTRPGTICHLLASHGLKENSKNKKDYYEDYQEIKGQKITYMYKDYSELGVLLNWKLEFRPMQRKVSEYLISDDKKKTENNIHRQKAEHAAFTHNVFGSFLDTVNAEYNARKSLEKITEELRISLVDICELVHNQKDEKGNPLMITGEEKIPDPCDEKCMKERNQKCIDLLIDKFAKSPEDKLYGTEGEYTDKDYNGIVCSDKTRNFYYDTVFCLLDTEKAKKLGIAKDLLDKLNGKYNKEDKNRVYEYLISIMKEIAALEKDDKEVTLITPDIDVEIKKTDMSNMKAVESDVNQQVNAYMDKAIKNANADRLVERKSDDSSISAMENQSQVVPYCPFYSIYHKPE